MKTTVSILLAFLAIGSVAAKTQEISKEALEFLYLQPYGIVETLNQTIEDLKKKLITGDAELGIPSFAPLEIAHLPVDLQNEFITAKVDLDNVVVSGVPDFVVSELKFALLKLTFKAEFEKIVVDTDYNGDAQIAEFIPVYGQGHINAELNNLVIDGSLRVTSSDEGYLQITATSIAISLGDARFQITGLLGDDAVSALISEALSDAVPNFLNTRKEWVTGVVSPLVESTVNNVASSLGITLDDILGGLGRKLN